jgi:hypothetical protein
MANAIPQCRHDVAVSGFGVVGREGLTYRRRRFYTCHVTIKETT